MATAAAAEEEMKQSRHSGGSFGGATPVPIPNTEVKPASADGTARVTVWESRSPPDNIRARLRNSDGLFLFLFVKINAAGFAKKSRPAQSSRL